MWLASDHPQGSRFCLFLPAADETDETGAEDTPAVGINGPIRALVVDDEEDVADLIAEVLTKDGFDISIAHSGTEALAHLEKCTFDVLLSDLNMPEMAGSGLYEVLVRKFPEMANRTGFITGDTMGKASQNLLQSSQRPYLEKPVSPAELRNLVNEILRNAKETNKHGH